MNQGRLGRPVRLIGLRLGLAPRGDLAAKIDDAANGEDLGSNAENDDKEHEPIERGVSSKKRSSNSYQTALK
jgi:hypothetical protein